MVASEITLLKLKNMWLHVIGLKLIIPEPTGREYWSRTAIYTWEKESIAKAEVQGWARGSRVAVSGWR